LVTLSLGDINTETWSSMLGTGCKADLLTLKTITVAKCKKVKTGCSNAQRNRRACQNFLMKAVTQRGLFASEDIVAYLLHARTVTSKHVPAITQQ
jgi:hypothetical protein